MPNSRIDLRLSLKKLETWMREKTGVYNLYIENHRTTESAIDAILRDGGLQLSDLRYRLSVDIGFTIYLDTGDFSVTLSGEEELVATAGAILNPMSVEPSERPWRK